MPAVPRDHRQIARRLDREAHALGALPLELAPHGHGAEGVGFPDRTILLPDGQTLFLRCILPGGVPTPPQAKWLQRLSRMGFAAGVYDGTRSLAAYGRKKIAENP